MSRPDLGNRTNLFLFSTSELAMSTNKLTAWQDLLEKSLFSEVVLLEIIRDGFLMDREVFKSFKGN